MMSNKKTFRFRPATAAVLTCGSILIGILPVHAAVTVMPQREVSSDTVHAEKPRQQTVRCHVVRFDTGTDIIGYVVGQGFTKKEATDDANKYLPTFGVSVYKRHCKPTPRLMQVGAYDTNMNPL